MAKTALVLSGGGAKGAFQVGAERYAREVKGYSWDLITGVSVGALNGAILAMRDYERLWALWNSITPERVFGKVGKLAVLRRMMFTRKSLFPLRHLKKLVEKEIDPSRIVTDFRIGAVSLTTGETKLFRPGDPEFMSALLASAAMPVFFPPVNVSEEWPSMVDGAIRSVAPIGTVLRDEPEELVIINCNPRGSRSLMTPPTSVFDISQRTFDIMTNEIFENDVGKFLRMNNLVAQAEAQRATLVNSSGRPFRRYPCLIIEPLEPLGQTLDFSQKHVQVGLEMGWERAKAVLG